MNSGSRKRHRAILIATAALLLFGGIGLYFAFGRPSTPHGDVTVRLLEKSDDGVNLHYRWEIAGGRPWTSLAGSYAPGPGSILKLMPAGSSLDVLFGNASTRVSYDLKLQLMKDPTGGSDRYNELLVRQGEKGQPAMSEAHSYECRGRSLKELVTPLIERETTLHNPKFVDFGTVDGQVLRFEIGE